MKDGGSYLQSDRSGSPCQRFAKRPLFAMPRRELVARRDDCGLSTGLLFSHFDPSIRTHARSLAATHLGLVRCYRHHGLHWWEFDISSLVIRGMRRVGMVYDVVEISPERQERKLAGGPTAEPAPDAA